MKIKSQSKISKTQQNFYVFTQEEWDKAKSEFPGVEPFFKAEKGSFFVIPSADSVDYLIGVGPEDKAEAFAYKEVGTKFSNEFKKSLKSTSSSLMTEQNKEQFKEFFLGLMLGTYHYPFEKNHPFWQKGFELNSSSINNEEAEEITDYTLALCEGQFYGMEWLNKPNNFKTVKEISAFLKKKCKELGIDYRAYNRKESIELGLNVFSAVNQGSSQDAAFTVMEYNGGGKEAKTIGLVGKCVLFDTGGISIKPSQNMHYMKSDMGGAAAVMGAFFAAAKMKLPINIVAILPITDNAVGEKAYIPSDVVKAYNGKTIEVLNTDAEGRMTLADALAYITKNYKTDTVIDVATLTGSAVRMFGYTCGAMFSNNNDLKNDLIESADKTNQRLWNLPLWDIWLDDIKSDVADFANISQKPFGDCIVAAKFLEQFIEENTNWAHLDIAGVAFGNVGYAKEKAATGYGVSLLVDYIKKNC